MKPDWQDEARKFRAWAKSQDQTFGEWECDYEPWPAIYQSIESWLGATDFHAWTAEEANDLLTILARDWECQIIFDQLTRCDQDVVFHLASQSLQSSDWNARWQLAALLSHWPLEARSESLLLRFAADEKEYVRRRALKSLALLSSSHTEKIALQEWQKEDENQQWACMNALWCWSYSASPLLKAHLRDAETSPLPHLSDYARRLRNDEIELP